MMNLLGDQFEVKICLHGMHEFIPLLLCWYAAIAAVDTVARITLQKILLPISIN